MSDPIAIEFEGVGKMYRLYKSRLESFLDITSLGRAAPWWNPKIENFWALRNVSFRLKKGSRLGIVGRNGAGKTTLLKLMTGNVMPSEGRINVQGEVQALLEAGAGFHPEFTGYENVEASLIQNGLTRTQIKAAIDEIAEFTELGDFLKQQFKTYSAGMQARLVFTTATTIKPDILIIDEILGAGDAYFAVKSRSRMRQLVDSGASILLVTHAMDQILQFCDEAIWLERGRIIQRGPTMEVVKAYEEFVHTLQDRQLKAVNRRRSFGFRDAVEVGQFANTFIVALALTGSPGARADIGRVDLRGDGLSEETVHIGDPQDSDQSHFAYVATNTGTWGVTEADDDGNFRRLSIGADGPNSALGELVFRAYTLEQGKAYSFRVRYRMSGVGRLAASVSRNGEAIVIDAPLSSESAQWQEFDVALPLLTENMIARVMSDVRLDDVTTAPIDTTIDATGAITSGVGLNDEPVNADVPGRLVGEAPLSGGDAGMAGFLNGTIATPVLEGSESKHSGLSSAPAGAAAAMDNTTTVRRWPGEGSLLIDTVVLRDSDGEERAVFRVGSPLTLHVHYRATRKGCFPVIYTVAIYRNDGIKVSQHVSSMETIDADVNERRSVRLEFPSVDLADGRYVVSVALHRELDPQFPDSTIRYDLLSYSYQFEIVGNPPLRTSLFVLPANWALSASACGLPSHSPVK